MTTTTLAGRPALAVRFQRSRELIEVSDLAAASALYARLREAAEYVGRKLRDATVYEVGAGMPRRVAVISYNGRVWEVVRGRKDRPLLHDPFASKDGAR